MQVLAPAPYANVQVRTPTGVQTFTADANGLISGASNIALEDLLAAGCAPLAFSPLANFRNVIDCGDFTINPWQRGTSFTGITNTPTYTADRWFAVGGASSSVSVSQQTNTTLPGFSSALQFQRAAANANTAAINIGQVVETLDTIRLQNQTVTLSFYAAAGANFSGSALTVLAYTGTGNNQSAALMVSGGWTGQAVPAITPNSTNGVANTAGAYGVGTAATQPITSALTRYSFTFAVPATATELGVLIGYAPTGTAGTTDAVQIVGVQLEVGNGPSVFEHRDIQVELEIAQRYCWVINEPAASVIVGSGMNTAASTQVFYLATPVQFRAAPTVTVSVGTFKTNQAGTATATTISAGATHTVNAISINGNSAGTAGQASLLQGGGGAGYVIASADL